ncbi:calcium-binding protein [Rhizobium sp.]
MADNIIDLNSTTTFVIDISGKSWLFEDGYTFSSALGGAINAYNQTDTVIILEGAARTTTGDYYGAIDMLAARNTVIVTETGTIEAGHTGIALHGKDSEIDNRGRIDAAINGVYASGDGFYLSNLGYIGGGTYGVRMAGNESTLTNHDVAEIRGTVYMESAAGETMWFNNYGTTTAKANVLIGGAGNDIIHNTGTLGGFVSLGAGNDVLDTRWGSLWVARVAGGEGDDMLITSRASYQLNELAGQGYDTVKTDVSYALSDNVEQLILFGVADISGTGNGGDNALLGNRVNNKLFGLDGDDWLDGRRGNDRLYGGEGADTFVFGSRYDMDRIMDFTHGEDTIDLSGWKKVDSWKDFLKRAENNGDDIWVIAGKDMLVIKDQQVEDMHRNDFQF